jgi:hypothetical protein
MASATCPAVTISVGERKPGGATNPEQAGICLLLLVVECLVMLTVE